MLLKEKVAIVTGGGQGIGKAIAQRLAQHEAQVVVCDIDEALAKDVAVELQSAHGHSCMGLKVDVGDFEQFKALAETVLEKFGKIDILVNNAGITRDQLLMRMSDEEWDQVLKINLKGAFNGCRAIVRSMTKQRCGRIINISSVVGIMGNAGQANYSASKAGLIGLTKTLAKELASRNITVNAVAPGFIKTRMTDVLSETIKKNIIQQIPLQRLGLPEDIANTVLFLASDLAGYITGEVIKVDGGLAM